MVERMIRSTFSSSNVYKVVDDVDTRRRATAPAFFVYLTKRVFFSQLGETKILLESSSSNLRELEIPN